MSALVKKEKVSQQPATAEASETSALISMIERAAKDPSVDIEKMERLFQMHERVLMRNAEAAFNASMACAQAELEPVARKRKNDHTKSKYADIESIYTMAKPIITKHGFAPSFGTGKANQPNHIRLVCDLLHERGFSRRYESEFPLDGAGIKGTSNKTDIQATGSTMTYGRRYMTLCMFDIATKDDNDGNRQIGFITGEQAEELSRLITETKSDIHKFLEIGGVDSLSDIPANQFQAAKAKLIQKKRVMDHAHR